jgi:hypothetical protein
MGLLLPKVISGPVHIKKEKKKKKCKILKIIKIKISFTWYQYFILFFFLVVTKKKFSINFSKVFGGGRINTQKSSYFEGKKIN